MAKLFNDLPGWGQFIVALIGMLIAGTIAYGNVKADVRLLQQKDTFLEQNIADIKSMLQQEMDVHHPRKK
jgi:hypothetical protein